MVSALRALAPVTALAALLALAAGAGAEPLRILLTNDDGYTSPGIRVLRKALREAGHEVVLVAPRANQSGSGGSLATEVGGFRTVEEHAPGVWSVDSTPSDAVRAALGAILAGDPPDLVISGLNFGQNLAKSGSLASGTVGAALAARQAGVPALATSVGIDAREARATPRFPSTRAAFEPAAAFVVRLVGRLAEGPGPLLPRGTLLNVNVPVPYEAIDGVEVTRLAEQGDFAFAWDDPRGAVAKGGGRLRIHFATPGPQPAGTDTNAHRAGRISITPLDGDMSAGRTLRPFFEVRLGGLAP